MREDQGFAVPHGPSILERLWSELDASYAKLVELKAKEKVQTHTQSKLQGICAGLASAIAIIINPYDPNEDAVREEVIARRKALRS